MKLSTFTFILVCCTSALAGLVRLDGSERELWTTDQYSVVVGTLKNVKVGKEPGWFEATFIPASTISGSFDCGGHPTLPVSFVAQEVSTSIKEIPKENALVIGFMQFIPKNAESATDAGFFAASICHFMPGESSLTTIKGIEDPVVHETLLKIQKARQMIKRDTEKVTSTIDSAGGCR